MEEIKNLINAKLNEKAGWYSRCGSGTGTGVLCVSGCCWGRYNDTTVSTFWECLSSSERCFPITPPPR